MSLVEAHREGDVRMEAEIGKIWLQDKENKGCPDPPGARGTRSRISP